MWKYVLKRIIMMIPIIFAIALFVFLIVSLSPGSSARVILGMEASEEDIAQWEAEMGLDKPLAIRFFSYVGNALRGDLGKSYRSNDPVISMIMIRFPTTLRIAVAGVLMSVIIGIPLGIISATKQYSIFDTVTTVGALVTYSLPSFLTGLFLIYFFSFKLDWLPSFGVDSWKGYILPSVALGIGTASSIMRTARSTLLEVIRQDYIRTARGKGIPEKVVVFRHALRNAIIPVITVAGNSFGSLLGGTVVLESVFSLPGMGSMLTAAIRANDLPVVVGGVIFLAVSFSLVNLGVDTIYAFVDPRIKASYKVR